MSFRQAPSQLGRSFKRNLESNDDLQPLLSERSLNLLIQGARRDGKLSLANKGIRGSVPELVWTMYDFQREQDTLSMQPQGSSSVNWWETVDLTRLVHRLIYFQFVYKCCPRLIIQFLQLPWYHLELGR
jgi:hypothetical protein